MSSTAAPNLKSSNVPRTALGLFILLGPNILHLPGDSFSEGVCGMHRTSLRRLHQALFTRTSGSFDDLSSFRSTVSLPIYFKMSFGTLVVSVARTTVIFMQ